MDAEPLFWPATLSLSPVFYSFEVDRVLMRKKDVSQNGKALIKTLRYYDVLNLS